MKLIISWNQGALTFCLCYTVAPPVVMFRHQSAYKVRVSGEEVQGCVRGPEWRERAGEYINVQ